MNFFDNNKNKSLLLTLLIGITISITGCSDTSTTDNNNSDFNTSNVNTSSTHTSSLESSLDTSKNNVLVIKATVDRVVDGDTVEIVLPDGNEVDTRLLLIDTPETKHPNLGVQKYGPEASSFAKSVLNQGDTIYFELDGKSKTDKYGRYLGYLWYTCSEHNTLEMYNERVVGEGLARVGYIYDQKKHLDTLLSTQDIAKSNRLNIWSIPGYVTEKGYDMNKVDTTSTNVTDSNSNDNSPNNKDNDALVYANTSSKIYHKESNSHGMKKSEKINKSKAESNGYKPCSTCF